MPSTSRRAECPDPPGAAERPRSAERSDESPPSLLARRALLSAVGAVSLAGLTAACGNDSAKGTDGRRITRAEADMIAELLVTNARAAGAHVVCVVPFGVSTFHLDGEIDWANHVGRLTIRATTRGAASPAPRDVVWNPNVVFEQVPGLAARLTALGRPAASWVARPLDPAHSRLHLILRLIDSTSSTRPDNPQLLRSKVRWLRRDRVEGVAVDVFRNQRTRYWVADDRTLVRLEAELAGASGAATLTFSDHGPRMIETPADPEIVALGDVADLYGELIGASTD